MTKEDLARHAAGKAIEIKNLVRSSRDFNNWLSENKLGARDINGNLYFWCNRTNRKLSNFQVHDIYLFEKSK